MRLLRTYTFSVVIHLILIPMAAGIHAHHGIDQNGNQLVLLPHEELPAQERVLNDKLARRLSRKAGQLRVTAGAKMVSSCAMGAMGALCAWQKVQEELSNGRVQDAYSHAVLGGLSLAAGFGAAPLLAASDLKKAKAMDVQALAAQHGAHIV